MCLFFNVSYSFFPFVIHNEFDSVKDVKIICMQI